MLVAFDCFLDGRDPTTIDINEFEAGEDEFRITYWKLIMYAVMPLLLGIIAISSWSMILKYKSIYGEEEDRDAM